MKYPLENNLRYQILALIVLAAFYSFYFIKMLAQKRRGIQTRQIGRRKEKSIHAVEVMMGTATLGGLPRSYCQLYSTGTICQLTHVLPDFVSE